MKGRVLFFGIVLMCGLTACLNDEVVRLNYQTQLETTFVFPDSVVSADTIYRIASERFPNPITFLFDSFLVAESSVDRIAVDTILVEVSAVGNSNPQLLFLDSIALFYEDEMQVLFAGEGNLPEASTDGFDAEEGISIHPPFVGNDSLQFFLYVNTREAIEDSVFLQFTFDLTVSGESK